MTISPTPAWPTLPNGSIDWEAVFEDPTTGLIPLITQAQTASTLRRCTILVIEQLHTRKQDPDVVQRFVDQLNEMVPDDTPTDRLPKLAAAITGILRHMKDDRIAKATAHALAKASSGLVPTGEDQPADPETEDSTATIDVAAADDADDRRQAADMDDIPVFRVEETKAPPYALYGGIGVATAAAAALAFYMLLIPSEPTSAETNKQFIAEMQSALSGKGPTSHVFGGALSIDTLAGRKAVTAAAVPPGACQQIAWSLAAKGNVMISGVMPKRVQPAVLKELCSKKLLGATLVWLPRKSY